MSRPSGFCVRYPIAKLNFDLRNAGHCRPDAYRGYAAYKALHGKEQALKIIANEKLALEKVRMFQETEGADFDFAYGQVSLAYEAVEACENLKRRGSAKKQIKNDLLFPFPDQKELTNYICPSPPSRLFFLPLLTLLQTFDCIMTKVRLALFLFEYVSPEQPRSLAYSFAVQEFYDYATNSYEELVRDGGDVQNIKFHGAEEAQKASVTNSSFLFPQHPIPVRSPSTPLIPSWTFMQRLRPRNYHFDLLQPAAHPHQELSRRL